MSMNRFVILFTMIAFVTVGCAGPGKVRWTKPDFRWDQFEKDRAGCMEAAKDDPEQEITLEECLTKKGYESQPEPAEKEKSKAAEMAKDVAVVLISTVAVAVLLAVMIAGAFLQSYGGH
jgi:hypothetical protein